MRKIKNVGVIGAGLMGHALTLVHAVGGCQIKMQDISSKQLSIGMGLIENALDTLISAEVVFEKDRAKILERSMTIEQKNYMSFTLRRLLHKQLMGELFKVIFAFKSKNSNFLGFK